MSTDDNTETDLMSAALREVGDPGERLYLRYRFTCGNLAGEAPTPERVQRVLAYFRDGLVCWDDHPEQWSRLAADLRREARAEAIAECIAEAERVLAGTTAIAAEAGASHDHLSAMAACGEEVGASTVVEALRALAEKDSER